MNPKQQEILKQLNLEGKLPTPKGIALELINLTGREDFSTADIVRLISSDPALSVRVLKAANALLHSIRHSVVTISDAVTVLGMRAIRQLVLAVSLVHDHQRGACKQFDYGYFWSRSLLTGIAMRHLAMDGKLVSAEEFFIVGLLAEIGELAMTTAYPDRFGNLLETVRKDELAELFHKERDLFGFDHAEVSAAILADLEFPALFQTITENFLRAETSGMVEGSREWKLLKALQVASLIAKISLALPSQRDSLIAALKTKAAEVAVEEKLICKIADACAKDWPQWTALFNIPARSIPSFAELFDKSESPAMESAPALFPNQDYKLRVLVVDDDRLMQALLSKMLTMVGHHVITATNGVEALEKIATEHPQLIVTDWQMPEMDGITLCREARNRFKNRALYITVVTAHEAADKLVDAFEAGADDYLIKPIIPKILYARLRAAQRVIKLQEELATDREQMLRFSTELSETNERLRHLSLTDALTELPNRRMAMDRLTQEWSTAARNNRPLSCMMLDIDHFKSINDTYGHHVGDEALKLTARTLRKAARAQDVVCRHGGEEFVVICPDTTQTQAHQVAERMRNSIAQLNIVMRDKSSLVITISIGIAERNAALTTMEALLKHADENMYAAKKNGRNRTVIDPG